LPGFPYMQRTFVTNLILVIGLNLLIKPFWILGMDRYVQIAVGAETYGFYYALFNFSFLLNILLDFGITNFNNKNISQHQYLLNKHLSSILVLRILLAVVFCIITITLGWIIGYTADMLKMLLVLVFNQALISFTLYLRSNLSGLHLFRTDSIISVTDRLIMIIICGFLLIMHNSYGIPFDIRWFIYAQTAGYFITAVITLFIVIDKAKLKKLTWRFPFFLLILKKSYPYAVLVLLMTFYNRIDTVMLERMLPDGAVQAGIYASAYRFLDAANMIAFLFAGLLLPMFASMLKKNESVEKMVHLSFCLLVVPAFVVSICSYFYSHDLMGFLYRKTTHAAESASVFRILMFCFIPISSTYIFGTLLTANGNLKQLNIMAATGMLINVTLNIILIPLFKVQGSAVSSLITQVLTAGAQIIMVNYIFRFHINYKLIFSVVLFIVLVAIICWYIQTHLHAHFLVGLMLSAGIGLALALLLRIISLRNLYYIVKYEQ
jgi:O-antigen/teichoic acid export membrane protein